MRKHVAPAHPEASIPDPDRGGFLPPDGRTVAWTPFWAGMLLREEITVGDPRDPGPPHEAEPPRPAGGGRHEPPPPGGDGGAAHEADGTPAGGEALHEPHAEPHAGE